MRWILTLLAASAIFAADARADLPSYALVKEKSYLKFFAIENGAPIKGRFNDFTADIHFDPSHPDQSTIKVEVNTGSVSVANGDVAQYIVLPDWLSVQAFPKAVFTCPKLTRMPESDNYYAGYNGADYCSLTLRGKTVPVTLNFQMERLDDKGGIATGYVTLHRNDFGIGQGEWAKDDVVKNEVRVEFRIVADKK